MGTRNGVVAAVTLALLVVLAQGAAALDQIDPVTWLRLYESTDNLAPKLYVLGMANGLTLSGAPANCAGISLSGDQLAATVAALVRDGRALPPAVLAALARHGCRIRATTRPRGGAG